jgi:hypothetical protein
MKTVDMSERAILQRLRQVDELRTLSLSLMKARRISKQEAGVMRAKLRADHAERQKNGENKKNTPP